MYLRDTPPTAEVFSLKDFLFDKQLKFVEDPRPYKLAVCSRRSGKTIACAADLVATALASKDVVCLYITLSRNNAKKLIWPELKKINRKYALGATEDATELSMLFPNGSMIYLSGAKDQSEIEKFRGLALKKCYIDECQSFREYIKELIDDIITPALLDYAGSLCLIGTPGPIPAGYFAEVAGVVPEKKNESDSWAHHGWTFFDNPHIEAKSGMTHQALLHRELKRRGVQEDDPSIQREFFGRWVLDSDSLWIHYNKDLNDYKDLDPRQHRYEYIMGIDLGFKDADAIAVLAWSDTDPNTYLVEEVVADKQGLTELVDQIKMLQEKYKVSKMVIDEGGLGKKLAEEMRRRHHLPVQPADKVRKQENVAFLNDALRTGRFKAKYNSNFVKDSFLVEIDRSKSTPDKIKLSDKYHSDIIDAVLYAFKESPAFTYVPPMPKLKHGTKEWTEAEQTRMFEEAMDHFQEMAEMENHARNMGWGDDY
jgi:phage terminase large subunit